MKKTLQLLAWLCMCTWLWYKALITRRATLGHCIAVKLGNSSTEIHQAIVQVSYHGLLYNSHSGLQFNRETSGHSSTKSHWVMYNRDTLNLRTTKSD